MAGNDLRKLSAGEKLKTIPREAYNAMVDAATAEKKRRRGVTGSGGEQSLHSGICYVQNATGDDLDRFSVVGIGDPVVDPSDDEDIFAGSIRLTGDTPADPDHVGKFAILLRPAPDGDTALALVSGITHVKLNVSDEDDEFAEIDDGETDELKTGATGSAQILWKESGTGSGKWAIVRLDQPTNSDHFTATIGAATQDGANKRWTYPITEVEKTGAGYGGWTALDGGRTGTAYNRIEDINGSSGLFGNGVDSTNLTGTFDIQPCPEDVPVEITVVHRADDGSDEFWFSYENGVDGACS